MSAGPAAARCAGAPLLEVDGLSAGYGPLAVLDNVSLKVGRGEVIALFRSDGGRAGGGAVRRSAIAPSRRALRRLWSACRARQCQPQGRTRRGDCFVQI